MKESKIKLTFVFEYSFIFLVVGLNRFSTEIDIQSFYGGSLPVSILFKQHSFSRSNKKGLRDFVTLCPIQRDGHASMGTKSLHYLFTINNMTSLHISRYISISPLPGVDTFSLYDNNSRYCTGSPMKYGA